MVTSGAVALGRQRVGSELTLKALKENIEKPVLNKSTLDKKACAAAGQNGLMHLYSSLFSQYGINVAQVLVTKADFQNEQTLNNLKSTLNYLMDAKIVPILNTNDAVAHPECNDIDGAVNINDNDSLAARLATMTQSDLLLLMSDVEGVYNAPPSQPNARFLHSFNPKSPEVNSIDFGEKSNVGTGGMESKINAAKFALENNVSVIICNGKKQNAIVDSVKGKKVGTFFTNESQSVSVESLAMNGKPINVSLKTGNFIPFTYLIKKDLIQIHGLVNYVEFCQIQQKLLLNYVIACQYLSIFCRFSRFY